MSLSRSISEKTLELNVIANMLEDERKRFQRASAYGFSLQYEARTGLDSTIDVNIPGRPTIVAFQFKKPYEMQDGEYTFEINNNRQRNQHNILRLFAVRVGRQGHFSVFYAFPCFVDMTELSINSPNFLRQTRFLDPYYIGPLND